MPISSSKLKELVAKGLSTREIAVELNKSQTNIRYWLKQHGLKTFLAAQAKIPAGYPGETRQLICRTHGETSFAWAKTRNRFICKKCRYEDVKRYRHRVKARLVDEAGGSCRLCDYNDCLFALHFHHIDPRQKSFDLGSSNLGASLARLRAEAAKCILLCNRCHVEVEAGVKQLPQQLIDQVLSRTARESLPS